MQKGPVLNSPEDLERLIAEHRALDRTIKEKEKKVYLTNEEYVEVKKMKMKKLQLKEKIEELKKKS